MSRPKAVPPEYFCEVASSRRSSSSEWTRPASPDQLDARLAQQPARGPVEQPVERIGGEIKPSERLGDPERNGQRVLNRHPFGGQFAGADVQEGQGGKAERKSDGVRGRLGLTCRTASTGESKA